MTPHDDPPIDERVRAVEENLHVFHREMLASWPHEAGTDEDVLTYWSDLPHPMLNGIATATFTDLDRAAEVLAPFEKRGLPFMWWATPDSTPEGLGAFLTSRGLFVEDSPGMHMALADPVVVPDLPGVVLEEVDDANVSDFAGILRDAFEMPDYAVDSLVQIIDAFPAERCTSVVARLAGAPVGAGTLFESGRTAGLYNIATLPSARSRGIGAAVTAWLMQTGREHGCDHAILHASEMGHGVYARLGFETVCTVQTGVWLPAG